MADLPSILGGMAQGFIDFGKGAVDLFGTGGAAIGDLVESARTGKVTTKNQDDFRKWLYNTDSVKDAAAKGLGTTLNGVQTALDYIPGVNALTRNPLGNAAQGALGGLADEFKTYGENYDLGRAGQRAAVSAAGAAASGSLADALKGSSNALLSSNTLQGLARGATGGAITGGGYAAIDGGDVLEAAKQGAGMGALIGGATGAFQDFKPAKTYDMALTDDERAARIANAQKQIDDLGPIRLFTDDPDELAKRARVHELQDTIKAYQSGYDTVQDYNDALAARRANRQPSLTREEYEAKMQQRIRDLGGNYEVTPEKQAQFDRLQKVNPMLDDYHTGIRAPQDIATLQEAINNAKDIDPAYKAMLQKALADDSVTVYSSYPIEEGVFTTPIKQMAQDYAGPGNQVYSKTISPNDIAWIDDQEGNYLPRPRMMDNTGQAVPQELAERLANASPLVRDENGNLMRFYHGTPDGSFDTFRDGSYFTPDRTYADTYQNPQASSISYGKQAVNPTTFETYLDIRKPFDISDPEARRVYIDEYIKGGNAMGINPYQDNYDDIKNIDWTEVENLSEFLRDGKYGYDALIADEGGVFDNAGNVVPRGKSYIPFSGDQVITLKKNSGISPETTKKLEKILSASEDAINNPDIMMSKLTPEQEAYFKDSVIRDENGNLIPLYHGSNSKFTVFDSSKGGQSNKTAKVGHWFTPNEEGAKNFANSVWYGDESEPTVYSTYLNVKNPKIYEAVDNSAQIKALNNEMDGLQRQLDGMRRGSDDFNATYKKYNDLAKQIDNLSYGDPYEQFRSDIYAMEGKTPYQANVGGLGMMMDDENAATQKYVQSLRDQGYDGIIIRGTNYDNGTLGGVNDQYVVFDSNQIKDINNLSPTDNPDIMMSKLAPGEADLARALANQDLSINNAKIAPGQLGLFDDMPTQTPKTAGKQTSLFDQPQETPAEPVNPYAPVDGKLTQAMKDRYWEVMKNADSFGGAIDNELYNKIDQSTLPKGYDKLRQLLDSQMGEDSKVAVELRKGIGTDIPLRADLDKLVEYVYGDEINGKQTFYKDLDESVRLNRKNAPLIGIDAEQAEADAKNSARNKLISRAIEKAERKVIDDVVGSGDSDDILYALQDYRRRGVRTGRAGALDTVLSERLGIAPGNTVKVTDVTDSDRLSSGALGRYARSERNIAVSDMNSPEGKVSTMAHERLHSFQNEARPESVGRYDPEVAEAYKQLQKDLGHYYKSNSEIKKRYKRDVDYWASSGEQESRMFQQYLENKGYTDNSAWRKMGGKADEWGNEINPAFDKFIDKLRDLSKRGIALPALTALFGGGAYMASQNNDKEKEVK